MSETTLNNYILKVGEIETASEDNTTTSSAMQTLLSELQTLDALIDTELGTESLPTTLTHLNKLIIVQGIRSTKIMIHSYLLNFINIRRLKQSQNIVDAVDQTVQDAYIADTEDFEIYYKSIVDGCTCMRNFSLVAKNIRRFC